MTESSNSYLTGPRVNVTWYSWATALSEIGTGLLFAYAGTRAKRFRQALAEPQLRVDRG